MSADITVRFWAGAQRAAGHEQEQLSAATLGELRALLAARPELARICAASSFLVDGQQAGESTRLAPGSVVDVLPPFAGGSADARSSGPARLEVVVAGRVQGVGFRDWTRRRALELGLRGSAVNRPDGRVAVVAEGPREALEQLLASLAGDDPPGFVGRVTHEWGAPAGEAGGFRMG